MKQLGLQRHIAPLWKGLIYIDRHAKDQGCAGGFWVIYGILGFPNVDLTLISLGGHLVLTKVTMINNKDIYYGFLEIPTLEV